MNEKWYKKGIWIKIFLIIAYPIGLILYLNGKKKPKITMVIMSIIFGLFILLVLNAILEKSESYIQNNIGDIQMTFVQDKIPVIFIAGVGQNSSSWDETIKFLPENYIGYSLSILDLSKDLNKFTIQECVDTLKNIINPQGKKVIICGLSIGAIIATEFAIQNPELTKGLIISGTQIYPNKLLVVIQNAIIKLIPQNILKLPDDFTKTVFLNIIKETVKIDTRESIKTIEIPILILCGEKDTANIKASEYVANNTKNSELFIIKNGGHELNVNNFKEINILINNFLKKIIGGI